MCGTVEAKTACLFDLIIVDVLSCTSPAGGGDGKRGGRDGDARGEDDKRQADQVRPLRVDSPHYCLCTGSMRLSLVIQGSHIKAHAACGMCHIRECLVLIFDARALLHVFYMP